MTRKRNLWAHLAVVAGCAVSPSYGGDIYVPAGGDLQSALNRAAAGDRVVLQAGATYRGNFVLPVKSGSTYSTLTTTGESSLPTGVRVTPSSSGHMATLEAANYFEPALSAASGAHHWRVIGLIFRPSGAGSFVNDVVRLGDGDEGSEGELPYSIEVDRVWIQGHPSLGSKRGLAMNGRFLTVKNSRIAGIWRRDVDAQAICGWNGPGPFTIANNYLEASGENVMFGGAPPRIYGLVPSDITVTGNSFYKPPEWRSLRYTIKNHFEIKNARRVTVENNEFDYNWEGGQTGFSILIKSSPSDSGSWAVAEDVSFTRNVVRHSGQGVNIYNARRITIRDNVFQDISAARWGGNGRLFQVLTSHDVTIDHNTGIEADYLLMTDMGASQGFRFTNNIVYAPIGVKGSGTGTGTATLNSYFPGYTFLRNALIGQNSSLYPSDNFFPSSVGDVGFVNAGGGDYRLNSGSRYAGAGSDGRDLGANLLYTGGTGPAPTPSQPVPDVAPAPPPPPPATTPTPTAPAPTGTGVNPATITLGPGQTQQFSAPFSDPKWTISPWFGDIWSNGIYKAPPVIPSDTTVTVMAESASDWRKRVTAVITLKPTTQVTGTIPVATGGVSPAAVTLSYGQKQQFTAPFTDVQWTITPWIGEMYANGVYEARDRVSSTRTITVTAESRSDWTRKVTATITLVP